MSFSRKILLWYDKNKRDLPWRRTRDPYKIWISEVMLQQTTVRTVLSYFERWVRQFPTIDSLANADIQVVLKAWQGLGYYNRARNLHKASSIFLKFYDGNIPNEPQLLRKVPGFGPYTTNAVLSIAFDRKLPIIDANVRRVFMRQLCIEEDASLNSDKEIDQHLLRIMPDARTGDFNQSLMELGALVCRAKDPACNVCPVQETCLAFKKGVQELIPKPKRTKIRSIKAVIGIIQDKKGRYLIQKRLKPGLLVGLWEFPGGKIEPFDKTPRAALKRELAEELKGASFDVGHKICQIQHYYTSFKIHLSAFSAKTSDRIKAGNSLAWSTKQELQEKYPMPSGSAKIIKYL
jgi:A/G-specific adenine glycosylase